LSKSLKRYTELDAIIKRLYEDKVNGSLSDKRFEILSNEYEGEQEELEKQIAGLQEGLDRFSEDGAKAGRFIDIVRKYTDFSELTAPMLNEFVEKILVHEVEIYLNFIAEFDVPRYEEAAPEAFDPVERQRTYWREYQRNYQREWQRGRKDRPEICPRT